jgi:DNA mismatch endonuclease, patch repair protein
MPDFLTKSKRSALMATIRSRGNKDTELLLVKLLRRYRINGWRRNQKVFGKPDFIFRQLRLALFVDGCFWHGCPRHSHWPNSNRSFWRRKFSRNKARDALVTRTLRYAGWRVLRVWEHELAKKNETRLMRRIQRALS